MLSTIDSKAMTLLMRRGRASWAELAKHLRLSPPAAAERVRKLEERGVIRGYAALVSAEALGYPLTAFVAVTLERPQHRRGFLRRVAGMKEIAECHHVAGEYDYLLKVRTRSPQDLDRVLSEKLKAVAGVARTVTTIVLSTQKESVEVPIA
ncbi:MAG: Lrp/AsnC family transcriptional regulator [Candidatus Solibacter usitatus]|nr:Lrp/AsnC family transcriptional regulator [Candidatus Solibacter usitatus]